MKVLIIDNRFVLGRSSRTENLFFFLKERMDKVDVYCRNRKFPDHNNIHKISALSLGIYFFNKLGLKNRAAQLESSKLRFVDVHIKWAINAAVRGTLYLCDGDLLISSSPDETNHLAALIIKYFRPGIHWISDWRDPWTDNKFAARYSPANNISASNNRRLERTFLKYSDVIWANTDFTKKLYISKLISNKHKVYTVRNGFKKLAFTDVMQSDGEKSNAKTTPIKIFFFGTLRLNEGHPWPATLAFLSTVDRQTKNSLELHYFANEDTIDHSKFDFLIRHPKMSYEKGMETMAKEAVMFIAVWPGDEEIYNGIFPQKIYDYFQLKRPILFVGPPKSEVSNILSRTNSGFTLDINNLRVEDFQSIIENIDSLSFDNLEQFNFEKIFTKAFSTINIGQVILNKQPPAKAGGFD